MKNNYLSFFKRRIAFCIMLFSTILSFAAEIHVSKTGVNAPTGRGASSNPYKTISYVFDNNLISNGDIVVIHAGVYRETVVVNTSGVTIKPFEDDKVTISGANWYGDTSWQADGSRPGVFKMTLNKNEVETDFTQLFVDGVHQQIARFPNNTTAVKNYISGSNKEMMNPLDQKSGFAVLLNASKPAGTNATGQVTFSWHDGTPKLPNVTFTNEAIVRGFIGKLRNNIFSYSQDGGQVTRASGNNDRMVTFKSFNEQGNSWGKTDAYSAPEGFGYIMDLSVLDYEGEWFYKQTENTLYYKPVGGTVTGKNFEVKKRKYALKVEANNVTIEKIHVKAATMEVKNAQNLTVSNCSFTYLFPYHYRRTYGVLKEGIVLGNADNTTFESCYIGHTWGSGIVVEPGSDNTVINNSIIEDIGWMGQFTVSLLNNGNNTQITNNTFGRASRFHIRTTESVYTKITDNDFYEAMAMGEDAGSIMFTSTGKSAQLNMNGTLIAWNRIHDLRGIPAYDTTPIYKRQKVVALYLEDVDNYTVHHNIVYNIKGDTYTSKRLQSDGVTPEYTESKGDVMYLGPRNRNLTRKMYYYNNTAWNYDNFLTFWQHDGGGVNDLQYKNNILMSGKPSLVGSISETSLYNFSQAIAVAPLNYNVTTEQIKYVSSAADHYQDAANGNFRLKSSSTYNSGGVTIANITSETDPTIGAWEGSNNWWKERVFNAGSNLTNASFDSLANPNSGLSVDDFKDFDKQLEVYPNPFKDQLNIVFGTDVKDATEVLITIVSFNGSVVLSQKMKVAQGIENSINTSFLASGIYLLEIKYKGGIIFKKIMK
ncbi:parallel beta-helix repeat protein [Wenyingzhuangia heitensis]|uniref:Parallel beta-helix repeat protein n=1 Tax=Wenyingzhuangia heitensis TaxID=1487859 RepID=A0ABX0UC39_9FLAO|nr:T9SS type A sorting domain-containing protein [Wenyingzhuangia heitensis]NIJ44627.1 parallel beta-helix repeat protein [Wenyingzhuangia heitensis]